LDVQQTPLKKIPLLSMILSNVTALVPLVWLKAPSVDF